METTLDSQLQLCLDSLLRDEPAAPLVDRAPKQRQQLRIMLEVAARLKTLEQLPTPEQEQQSLRAFISETRSLQRSRHSQQHRILRPLIAFASVMATAIMISVGVVGASASALPGDPLYGVKRFVESAQESLTFDGAARAKLESELYQRRMDEILALQRADAPSDHQAAPTDILSTSMARAQATLQPLQTPVSHPTAVPHDVEFIGVVTSISNAEWIIGGLNLSISAATNIQGAITLGAWVQVQAWKFAGGALQARRIELKSKPWPASATPDPRPHPTERSTSPAREQPHASSRLSDFLVLATTSAVGQSQRNMLAPGNYPSPRRQATILMQRFIVREDLIALESE